jgi:6-phosphofructokinase
LKVYPNPTQNNTVIFETLGQNISDIQLWNTLGQSIDTAINPSSKVELNGLKAGVYIYQASAKKQTTKGKIIVL